MDNMLPWQQSNSITSNFDRKQDFLKPLWAWGLWFCLNLMRWDFQIRPNVCGVRGFCKDKIGLDPANLKEEWSKIRWLSNRWLLHCKKLCSVKCGQGFDCSVNRASMGHCTGTGEGGVVIIFKQRRSPANITAGANDLFFSSQSTRLQYKVQRQAVFCPGIIFMEAVKTNFTRNFIITCVISKTSEHI